MIEHENNLINHRFSWFLGFQGFLFAAASLFLTKEVANNSSYLYGLAALGVIFSISIFYSFLSADSAIKNLTTKCPTTDEEGKDMPPVIGFADKKYLYPWFVMPIIVSIAWICLCCSV